MSPVIIDAHTHIFPPVIVRHPEEYRRRDRWFGELYASPRALLATAEDLLASMNGAAIDISVVCGFPWADPGLCREHNDYLAAACREYPGRIAWLGIVVPGDPGAPAEAERCFREGASGIGELNADAQGFDFAEPRALAPLVEVCQAYAKPLLVHVSEPLGHLYPGKGSAWPQRFIRFLEAFPDQVVVAAHWGGGLPFYELMPEVARAARNVVYDSAASTYLYRFEVFRTVIDVAGAHRVLMATDYPVLRQKPFLERVRRAGLTEQELAFVLGENAARVFDLPARRVGA
uniref:Amidohydrolase n=1 Tax=Thermorudis sp. TaxID=1969470 RepID=A0A7C2WF23_9BACT